MFSHLLRPLSGAIAVKSSCILQLQDRNQTGQKCRRKSCEWCLQGSWREGENPTLSSTLVWKILQSVTIKVGGVVSWYGPLLIVASGLESSSAYQLSDRQRAALFSSTDTRRGPSGCQVPPDPAIPRRWQLQAPWQIRRSHITIAQDRFH